MISKIERPSYTCAAKRGSKEWCDYMTAYLCALQHYADYMEAKYEYRISREHDETLERVPEMVWINDKCHLFGLTWHWDDRNGILTYPNSPAYAPTTMHFSTFDVAKEHALLHLKSLLY